MAATFGNLPKKGETVRGGKVISNWDPNGYKRVKKADVKKYWAEQGWRYLTDTDTGKSYKVPADDYQEFYTWYPTKDDVKPETPDKDMIKYIKTGFQDKHSFKVEGCGHIKYLEYDEYRMLLRVTFWDDTECVYFRVPTAVAGQLRVYAITQQTQISAVDNKVRHLLGIRFWDLVRIRGTLHGTRYRFIYTKEGTRTSASSEVDWNAGKYVFVPNTKGEYVAKELNSLTKDELEQYNESKEAAKESVPYNEQDAKLSIRDMYSTVRQANITESMRKAVLSKMDTMKDNEEAMRNFLGIIGLF